MTELIPHEVEVTLDNIGKILENDRYVEIMVVTYNGEIRCRKISKAKFLAGVEKGIAFDSLVFLFDHGNNIYGSEFFDNFESKVDFIQGGGDWWFKPDLSTFRRKPWARGLPVFLGSLYDPDNVPVMLDSRNLMSSVMDKFKAAGLTPYVGTEVEFATYNETSTSFREKIATPGGALKPFRAGVGNYIPGEHESPFYQEVLDCAFAFRMPIESIGSDGGRSIDEAALEYTKADEQADRTILCRHLLRGVGEKHGVLPIFMAMTNEGNQGAHFHMSLVDDAGKNAFYSEEPIEGPAELEHISHLGRSFIAGILDYVSDLTCMIAPTITSYKRYAKFPPLKILTWGTEHRGAAVRLIHDHDPLNTRLEIRLASADANPHLAMSAILSVGLLGIEKKLKLAEPTARRYYDSGEKRPQTIFEMLSLIPSSVKHMAGTLEQAAAKFKAKDSVAHELFDENFVEHFARSREAEVRAYQADLMAKVSSWELSRYGLSI